MTTTPATLRQQMTALTRAQPLDVLTGAWVAAATQRRAGDTRWELSMALDLMTAELLRRGVGQETLDAALWTVQMDAPR